LEEVEVEVDLVLSVITFDIIFNNEFNDGGFEGHGDTGHRGSIRFGSSYC